MRTFLLVLLAACRSEIVTESSTDFGYDLDSMVETETQTEIDTGSDTGTVPSEDTYSESEPPDTECGFLVPRVGDEDAETHSLAVFSTPLAGTTIEVRQGETVSYPFSVGALECGDIDFNLASIVAIDMNEGEWLHTVNDARVLMDLTNVTDGITYEPHATSSLNNNADGAGLFYTWYDCVTGSSHNDACGNMETVAIEAGDDKDFEFTFTATEYIPVGTQFTLGLSFPMWTDKVTGEHVWERMATTGFQMNVLVVE